ncbi:MAG: WbqC family protein [Tatlockia sp.]|nr:WbqC family protein [Tatlockia sp.]
MNRLSIEIICKYLNIKTIISNSSNYTSIDDKSEPLAVLCLQSKDTKSCSSLSVKGYIDKNIFTIYGIKLISYFYLGYPEYSQLWGDFSHRIFNLDLFINYGKNVHRYMRH